MKVWKRTIGPPPRLRKKTVLEWEVHIPLMIAYCGGRYCWADYDIGKRGLKSLGFLEKIGWVEVEKISRRLTGLPVYEFGRHVAWGGSKFWSEYVVTVGPNFPKRLKGEAL